MNRQVRREITTDTHRAVLGSGPSLVSGIGIGLGLGLGGSTSTKGFRHTLSSSSIHDALYVPTEHPSTTEVGRGVEVSVRSGSGSGVQLEGVLSALMNVRGVTTQTHTTAAMTTEAAALAAPASAIQGASSSSTSLLPCVCAVVDVYHYFRWVKSWLRPHTHIIYPLAVSLTFTNTSSVYIICTHHLYLTTPRCFCLPVKLPVKPPSNPSQIFPQRTPPPVKPLARPLSLCLLV